MVAGRKVIMTKLREAGQREVSTARCIIACDGNTLTSSLSVFTLERVSAFGRI